MAAMINNAKSIIAFHNHPSGDPAPSRDDIFLTQRLKQAGQIMCIELLDHLITGEGRYVSFKEKGLV
jgi:DNA repair protein RadC